MTVQEQIKELVESNDVVLFMKGSPDFPQCGFSGRATQILNSCGAKFASVDVLQNNEVREGIKVYSSWPTIPQLYIGGEFVGGSDILMELYENGELQQQISQLNQESPA
ncbi:MAG: monothiol glutaredoxin [Parasphingorhabdus sp.]|jgi:monothiol glutaredoxin